MDPTILYISLDVGCNKLLSYKEGSSLENDCFVYNYSYNFRSFVIAKETHFYDVINHHTNRRGSTTTIKL